MKFEMPKMNVEEFEIVDVIMTSLEDECPEKGDPDDLPLD